jgi:hypothetical protein
MPSIVHFSRLATFFLGAWLMGSFAMYIVATNNFKHVDWLLGSPSENAATSVEKLGRAEARTFLRHVAAEQNRYFFNLWEWVQLGLGLILFVTLFLAVTGKKGVLPLSLAMIIVVAILHWILTPEINRLGRIIDFVPASEPSAERTQFWYYHNAYSWIEVFKIGLGLALLYRLLTKSRRSRKVHEVDDADDGGIDR